MTKRHPTAWHSTSFASVCLTHVVKVLSRACLFIAVLILATPLSAQAKPPFPVIFIHGIWSSAATWGPTRDYLTKNGWKFGGSPSFDSRTGQFLTGASPGDFYTMSFSDSDSLSFEQQGEELDYVIQLVLNANPGETKVILVSHSMGGLAARAYVQPPRYHDDNVARLITIGTPNLGADGAIVAAVLGVNKLSEAVKELEYGSDALVKLNNLVTRPLPKTVSYVSLTGIETNSTPNYGDGVVDAFSQGLLNLPGITNLHLEISDEDIYIAPCHFLEQIFDEVHTCETSDQGVLARILHNIATVPTPNTAPLAFFDAPAPNATVTGPISVAGWAIDHETPSGSLTLTLLIDNVEVPATSFTRHTRTDVCHNFPDGQYPGSCQSGFSATWDPAGLSGPHTVAVRVTDGGGLSTTLGPRTVTVSGGGTVTPHISSVSPNPITYDPADGYQTLTINGSSFVNKPSVTLTWTGQSGYALPSSNVTFISSTQLTISIRLGASADSWTVKVTNPDGQPSNAVGFTVR